MPIRVGLDHCTPTEREQVMHLLSVAPLSEMSVANSNAGVTITMTVEESSLLAETLARHVEEHRREAFQEQELAEMTTQQGGPTPQRYGGPSPAPAPAPAASAGGPGHGEPSHRHAVQHQEQQQQPRLATQVRADMAAARASPRKGRAPAQQAAVTPPAGNSRTILRRGGRSRSRSRSSSPSGRSQERTVQWTTRMIEETMGFAAKCKIDPHNPAIRGPRDLQGLLLLYCQSRSGVSATVETMQRDIIRYANRYQHVCTACGLLHSLLAANDDWGSLEQFVMVANYRQASLPYLRQESQKSYIDAKTAFIVQRRYVPLDSVASLLKQLVGKGTPAANAIKSSVARWVREGLAGHYGEDSLAFDNDDHVDAIEMFSVMAAAELGMAINQPQPQQYHQQQESDDLPSQDDPNEYVDQPQSKPVTSGARERVEPNNHASQKPSWISSTPSAPVSRTPAAAVTPRATPSYARPDIPRAAYVDTGAPMAASVVHRGRSTLMSPPWAQPQGRATGGVAPTSGSGVREELFPSSGHRHHTDPAIPLVTTTIATSPPSRSATRPEWMRGPIHTPASSDPIPQPAAGIHPTPRASRPRPTMELDDLRRLARDSMEPHRQPSQASASSSSVLPQSASRPTSTVPLPSTDAMLPDEQPLRNPSVMSSASALPVGGSAIRDDASHRSKPSNSSAAASTDRNISVASTAPASGGLVLSITGAPASSSPERLTEDEESLMAQLEAALEAKLSRMEVDENTQRGASSATSGGLPPPSPARPLELLAQM